MRRAWCVGLVALGILVVAAPVVALVAGGISARSDPSALEVALARRLRSWAIPGAARALTNPLTPSPRALEEGRAHFADHCASCHANDGSGDTPLGRSLYPRAPDMRAAATQSLTDGELFYVIENGVRLTGMPAWGGAGRPEESWKLVHFIRHLPTLTPDEKAGMERLNPRSAHEWQELQEEEDFLRGEAPGPEAGMHGARERSAGGHR